MGRLAGRRALVTGGGSGIGAATARLFAAEGARVAVAGRTAAKLERVAAEVRAAGGECLPVAGDLADPEVARAVVARTVEEWGGIDVLFLNAGTFERGTVLETSVEQWHRTLRDNLDAAHGPLLAALPEMVQGGGGVVLFNASTIGLRPIPGAAAYCVAKAAVVMLARTVALEYGRKGIRSVCIAPGIVDTPIHAPGLPEEERQRGFAAATAAQPLPRVGRPEDVARTALFLASDDASWVTGDVVCVDGGISLV